nr:MAG TPA: hypothetical protein [Caudoviricetes sp.]
MADVSENLFKAIDIITSKRISQLQFDKTIVAEIIDNKKAKQGEYSLSDGSANEFIAYSENEDYKKGDSVYVNVPNGDFNSQKRIVGRHIDEEGKYLTYKPPLDKYVNITGDLCPDKGFYGLLANRPDKLETVIWQGEVNRYQDFTRIGIKAEFKSWLNNYKPIEGNYGVRVDLRCETCGGVATEKKITNHSFYLDSVGMYGNPYNFESFYSQEGLYDLSKVNGYVVAMRVVFYQDANFLPNNRNLNAVPYKDGQGNYLPDNLFVRNIEVGLGYEIGDVEKNTVFLTSRNGNTYNQRKTQNENRKELKIQWVREGKQGLYVADTKEELPEDAIIHLYKYKLGLEDVTDELAGPLWLPMMHDNNSFDIFVDPDLGEPTTKYKAIIESPSMDYINATYLSTENKKYSSLLETLHQLENQLPGATEEIKNSHAAAKKAFDSYVEESKAQRRVYESKVLTLTSEVPVADTTTADLINALKIEVDKEGMKGNYFLYNEMGGIRSSVESNKLRKLKATYNSVTVGDKGLEDAESITWKIPLINTMIVKPEEGKEFDTKDGVTSFWIEDNAYFCVKRIRNNRNSGHNKENLDIGKVNQWTEDFFFRIKDYYMQSATNNIISVYVTKNNITYKASAELFFGPTGSNGTDFTFRMSFDSDTVAFTGDRKFETDILRVNLNMFDYNNDIIPSFWKHGIDIKWYSKDNKVSFCDANGELINTDKLTVKDNHFYIRRVNNDVPYYNILEAVVAAPPKSKATTNQKNQVKLTTRLPIPWRKDSSLIGMEGATTITYDSSGVKPRYNTREYCIWKQDKVGNFNEQHNSRVEGDGVWQVLAPQPEKYYPKMNQGNSLIVPSMYVQGLSKEIAVTYTSGDLQWVQPILMEQDAYSSAYLNAWDGNLTIDEKNDIILSAMIGAGFKDNQNRFNGILMGDLRPAFGIGKETGLFGFHEGVESFGWKVDGTGFIGKKGHGQILFDGNKGIIKSGTYQADSKGMEIDLDGSDGNSSSFKAYGQGGKFELNTIGNGTPLLSIKDASNRQMMYIDSGKYYLQSANYSEGTWGSGMHINLSNGDIKAKDFHLRINIDNERKIVLDSADEVPLQIGDRAFSVNYRGKTVFNVNPPYWQASNGYVDYRSQGLFTKANSIIYSPDSKIDSIWPKEATDYLEDDERPGGADILGGGTINLNSSYNVLKSILDNSGSDMMTQHSEYSGEGDIFQVANWGVNVMGWNFTTRGILSGNGAHYIRNNGGVRFLTTNMKMFLSDNTFLVGKKTGSNTASTPRLVIDDNGFFMTINNGGINDFFTLSRKNGQRKINLKSYEVKIKADSTIDLTGSEIKVNGKLFLYGIGQLQEFLNSLKDRVKGMEDGIQQAKSAANLAKDSVSRATSVADEARAIAQEARAIAQEALRKANSGGGNKPKPGH